MLQQLEDLVGDLHSMWRFRWHALITAWVVCVLGWLVVFVLPSKYETKARVYVDTNSLLRPLLQGIAVAPNTISQVEMVQRVLLARAQLDSVINNTDLKARVHNDRERASMIDDLSKTIQIKAEGGGGEGSAPRLVTFYTISYRDSNPKIAYDVVNNLLDSFVQQSLGANRSSTRTAQVFLTDQLKSYEARLSESEKKLAEFKRNNLGAMPDERGGYFARLQADMTELDRLKSALSVALARQEELRSKLVGGAPKGDSNGKATAETTVLETSVDTQLAAAKSKLADLLLRFTENHPDVISLQETIRRLEDQRNAEIASLRENRGAVGAARGSSSLVAQNLQIALNQVEVEVTGLQSQIADRQNRIGELRRTINTVPEVEAELARLTRDYTVTKTQYDQLLQRLESARLSDQADQTDELKIRVVDPPQKSLDAVFPKLSLFLAGVLLAGLGAGGGIAWLLSKINPVFSRVRQLSAAFSRPVLGSIDEISSVVQVREHRIEITRVAGGLVVLLVVFAAVMILGHEGQAWGATVRHALVGT